jgi:ankyrin repeat protein
VRAASQTEESFAVASGLRLFCALTLSVCLAGSLLANDNPLNAKVFDSARTGDAAQVRELLAHGADPNTVDKNGRTPLMEAAFGGYTDTVRVLLDYGAHVDAVDLVGWTPLFWAAFSRRTDTVRVLTAKGADVNFRDNQQRTPLFWAASSGYTDTVRVLLAKGASVNATDSHGWTPLMTAADLGHIDTVRALLEKRADVHVRGRDGSTAQSLAEKYKFEDIVALLQNPRGVKPKGATIAANSKPPVASSTTSETAAQRQPEGKKSAGEPAIAPTVKTGPPSKSELLNQKLLQAAESGDTAEVLSLIREGAGVNAGGPTYGNTALIDAAARGYSETVRALLEKGAEVDGHDNAGRTALMEAAFGGYTDTARLLLEKGANVNAMDDEGWSPLFFAAFSRRSDTARFLLEQGADVNAKNKYDDCALIHAAYGGDTETVKVLLGHQAEINAKDDMGRTALMEASRQGHLDTVRMLLENGAAIDAQAKDGASALSLASQQHHADIVALLKAPPARKEQRAENAQIPVAPSTQVSTGETSDAPTGDASSAAKTSQSQAFYRLGLSMRLVEEMWPQTGHVAERAAGSIVNDLRAVGAPGDLIELAQQTSTRLGLPIEDRKKVPPVIPALRTRLNAFCIEQAEGKFFFTLGEFTFDLNQLGVNVTKQEESAVEESRLKNYLLANRFAAECAAISACKDKAFSFLSSAAEILQKSPLAPVDGTTIRKLSDNIGLALGTEDR